MDNSMFHTQGIGGSLNVNHSVLFNDKYVVQVTRGGTELLQMLDPATLTLTGATTALNYNGQANFIDTGSTLEYWYINDLGSTASLYRINSQDGETWGNTQIIHVVLGTDAAIGSVGGYGGTIVYITKKQRSSQPGDQYSLESIKWNGSAWGATTIYSNNIWLDEANTSQQINVIGNTSGHFILLNCGSSNGISGDSFRGLRVIWTDGTNLLGEKEIIDTNNGNFSAEQGPASFGLSNSRYAIPVTSFAYTTRKNTPTTQVEYTDSVNTQIIFSNDGWNWSIPIRTPPSFTENPVCNGTSPNEFAIFSTSAAGGSVFHVRSRTLERDISADVISYQNQNNERISLRIGNFK